MPDKRLQGRETFLAGAEALLADRLFAEAMEAAEARLRGDPADIDAKIIRCRALIGMERMQEAMRCLGEIEGAILGFSLLYVSLGELCGRNGLRDEAVTYYRRFLALHPHSPIAEEVGGRLAELLNEPDHAKTLDSADREAKPLAADFQTVTMADLYVRQGHLDEAAGLLERIVQQDPNDAQALRLLSEVREKMAMHRTETPEKELHLVAELQRWLDNLERMRSHGI
ncbi:MAG: Tetratricopeptide repeat protein [Syntrophaceae bacterium PtaU1.Bin231]|nr:MAG: Tetratricopeptide repeat protein [Syntrophaceae bacterium PtaU1.Bin231]